MIKAQSALYTKVLTTGIYAVSIYWITRFSFTRKLCSVMGVFQIKHLYIRVIPSVIPSPHCKRAHYLNSTRDDKNINNCSFKFSVACFNRRRQG